MVLTKMLELFLKSRHFGYADEGARTKASQVTLDYYQFTIKKFLNFLEKRDIYIYDKITKNDVREYCALIMSNSTWSDSTKYCYLRGIRTFLHWVERTEDYAEYRQFSRYLPTIPKVPKSKYPSKTLDSDTLNLLNQHLKENIYVRDRQHFYKKDRFSRTGLRNYVMFLLLLDSGMRIGELASLKLESFLRGDNCIVCKGKTGQRLVILKKFTLLWIERYIKNREKYANPNCSFLFLTESGKKGIDPTKVNLTFRRIKDRLGLKGRMNPHAFRHYFGSQFIKKGGNVVHLQKLMGHSNIDTTMQYVEILPDDLIKAHDDLSPINQIS